ncbi:MAG: acetyl-CoA carboxylase biotin carboxyl carrier protein [Desulfuromonadales bacterium]|nr:acetyl-CoA carboxylase biotin carboxyl carrier protein [Desulfuromonadales bacterium]MDT8423328.1 acetyl-CoA carboxylase biotin carboxyl carrier protein [Desulfuromonadales bacterium]
MDIKDLKTLIKLVTDTDITEFEIENSEEKILIKRGSQPEVIHMAAPQPFAAAPLPVAPAAATAVATTSAAPVVAVDDKYETITSPIVGTFYRKPGPDADCYVEVGTTVDAGATVCLVEAMKMFNEIEAEFKCRIVEILKEDAAPVEYGEPLFKVERI